MISAWASPFNDLIRTYYVQIKSFLIQTQYVRIKSLIIVYDADDDFF